jgi:urea transporter
MKLRRRQFLHLAAGVAALPAVLPIASTRISSEALAQPIVVSEIAPLGKLRVGMLGYNPALVARSLRQSRQVHC